MSTFEYVPKPEKGKDDPPAPVPLRAVLEAEQTEIGKIRQRRKYLAGTFPAGDRRPPARATAAPIRMAPTDADEPKWQTRDKEWVEVIRKAHEANLVGLAFSGGGIRSATFNLGVLQALADLKLLYRVDYLSTVSGGGYIGGWLAALTKRLKSFAKVQERLRTNRVHQDEDNEPTEIRFLRVFSNYLTPKLGIFSGDTWAIVAIYLRNLLLNLTVVLAVLATLLLALRTLQALCVAIAGSKALEIDKALIITAGALLLVAFWVIGKNMAYLDWQDGKVGPKLTEQGRVLVLVGLPLFLAAAALAAWWHATRFNSLWKAVCVGAAAYGLISLIASLAELLHRRTAAKIANTKEETSQRPITAGTAPRKVALNAGQSLWTLIAAVGAGALAGSLYALVSNKLIHQGTWEATEALTAGVPLVVGIFLLTGVLQIGLMGTAFPEAKREWWGRLGGWLLLWALIWIVIFWVSLYFPGFIQNNTLVKAAWKALAAKYLTPAWILTTLMGVLAGKSAASGRPGRQTWQDAFAKVGPYVFIAGLLCWLSWGINRVLGDNTSPIWRPCAALAVCAGVAVVMAWRVDINLFSMHLFYRNRLVRCYLGASNEGRSPNRFTGFDPNDDIPLKELRVDAGYDGPYPILNASLNLVKGKDLAWQERKAESFVMTPRYCGYDVWLEEQDSPMVSGERTRTDEVARNSEEVQNKAQGGPRRYGYCKTEDYAFPSPPWVGPKLGLAMGVSGAAASPNMGFHSSPPVAFLMTVFNVRLGQWLGNPRHSKTSGRPTPRFGLPYLVNELLGGTDDEARYVYLSDGGHFDNLGLYELVKRRCGLIVVCDAEEDKDYQFAGLGNAIRKCRTDMGIDIELDVSEVTPKKADGSSRKHCAIGKIHYEYADANAPMGTIIYFKASLTGDEPSDVKNYKKTKTHASFPHESTIDQWFSESQFESYRELGYHEVISSTKGALSVGTQPAAADWWSAAGAAMREVLGGLEGGAPHHENAASEGLPMEEQLREICDKFGFDTSAMNAASES